ncbi:hypothetical protein [Planococcus sp. 107-1]|uniref:hypothetical protein n=1 Tax=Planococcus sp. 107-1 TaxID=2908840 RepID=UPI001F3114A2|nr:hypothetical protein [Planococcus sp. 107-1]UJF26323.1 hypothetical protein L0M13_14325 [Planococcus sp. 107-1]
MGIILRFVFSLLGIVLISGFPVLIGGLTEGELRISAYISSLQQVLKEVWPLQEFSVMNMRTGREIFLFPTIAEYILYSLQILFLAFAAAVVFALVFTVLTMLLSEKARER